MAHISSLIFSWCPFPSDTNKHTLLVKLRKTSGFPFGSLTRVFYSILNYQEVLHTLLVPFLWSIYLPSLPPKLFKAELYAQQTDFLPLGGSTSLCHLANNFFIVPGISILLIFPCSVGLCFPVASCLILVMTLTSVIDLEGFFFYIVM